MEIKKVLVIGLGSMGVGIAQVVAQAGFRVEAVDKNEELLAKASATIETSLAKLVSRQKITQVEMETVRENLKTTTDLEAAAVDCDLAIEAVYEDLELKRELFEKLDAYCPQHAILASNTSSLPITALAAATKRPELVMGMHFMNPVPLMRGVELIKGILTAATTMVTAKSFIEKLDKVPVEALDYPGFIASRVLDVMLNEAVYCVMDGNKPEEIDKCMKVCTNMPMGPLELIDLAGADILLNVMDLLHRELGDKYKAAPLLRQMVRAGHCGRKSGRGFYDYRKLRHNQKR